MAVFFAFWQKTHDEPYLTLNLLINTLASFTLVTRSCRDYHRIFFYVTRDITLQRRS